MMKVYLDHAATSPIKEEVLAAMMPYLTEHFGNPSSIHGWGRDARVAIDNSRESIASFLGAQASEIIFTSGGTESDNFAIKGLVLPFIYSGKEKPHIITSAIEHHAVFNSCKTLEKSGIEVTYIKPSLDGLVSVEDIKNAIKPNTVLVSIMYVNNEIGTIQPISEIGKMIKQINQTRTGDAELGGKIYFHTDAVQATQYQEMNVDYLHVDLLSLSSHKIGAPKGTGALYIRKNTPIIPMMHGGEQELNMRAGTENVAGIVALAQAIELVKHQKPKLHQLEELRNYFVAKVLAEIPETELNGSVKFRSPSNANFYFTYIEGESILMNLDLVGIAASSGSACTSLSLQPSHVIMAVYDEAERAHGSIRFTLSNENTKAEIDYVIENLKTIVKKLRAMSPLAPKGYK
jgi:cysteine desulfurase